MIAHFCKLELEGTGMVNTYAYILSSVHWMLKHFNQCMYSQDHLDGDEHLASAMTSAGEGMLVDLLENEVSYLPLVACYSFWLILHGSVTPPWLILDNCMAELLPQMNSRQNTTSVVLSNAAAHVLFTFPM